MATAKHYRVIGPLALFTLSHPNGPTLQYLYRDAQVPPDVDPDELAHNIEAGLVEEADPFDPMPDPVGTPAGKPVAEPVKATPATKPVAAADESGPPAKNAAKADWVAFAVTRGAAEAEAEASTKDALIDKYGD